MARLFTAHFGPPATRALSDALTALRDGDPLRPVDVVVPSALAGVTLRRALADPALANVRFGSLPQLAERLARRRMARDGTRPLSESARAVAVRRALQQAQGPLATAAAHPATAGLLTEVLAELDEVEAEGRIDAMAATGDRAAEVADLHTAYRAGHDGLLTGARIARLAAEAVRGGDAPDTSVVLFAPHRLSPAERDLLTALADTGRLHCVLATTGEEPDEDLARWLGGLLGPAERVEDAAATDTRLVWAPDAEEEVREAVRTVLAFLTEHPVRPERVAIAYRSAAPYPRLLDEQLTVAGLPFHVSGGRQLTDSVAGRTLLRLLHLKRDDYARSELMGWLADAPVLTAGGDPVPVARWERLSRNAGVSRGHDVWRSRLERYADQLAEQREETDTSDPGTAEDRRRRIDRRITECRGLLEFVDEVANHCEAVAGASSWADVATATRTALVRFLGAAQRADRWVTTDAAARWRKVERSAYDAVLTAVDRLALIDGVGGDETGAPAYDTVLDALRRELETSLPSGTTLGRGVAVAPVKDLVGADLDLLVVLGMTEDAFPPRMREHPVLDDAARSVVGLPTTEQRRRAERRDYLAAVASSRQVVLSSPKADVRSQRGLHPSPWFMEAVTHLNRKPVLSADLEHFDATWFRRLDSFVQALFTAPTPASGVEADTLVAMAGAHAELAVDDARYARAREALEARNQGSFGPWSGHVDELSPRVRERVDGRLSASSLEKYAGCPLRFWLDKTLGVRDLEDPGDDEVINRRTRGSLVHRVLERFLTDELPVDGPEPRAGRPPEQAWTPEEIGRALAMFEDEAVALEAAGVTGRPLLWQAEKARLRRQLTRLLVLDSRMRAERRTTPVAVEAAFGREGVEPLVLDLPRSGPVALAGSIDRVDLAEDGTVVVTDYKTGSDFGYERVPKVGSTSKPDADMVDRGRKLQLVLYGLAARRDHGRPESPVQAYYWFVERDGLHRGGPVEPTTEQRLLEVLDVSVSGVHQGVFPARPGDEDWRGGWKNCTFCPYNRVCPTTRAEQWESVRHEPAVRPYADLAEPESAAPTPTAEPAAPSTEEP